MGIDARFLERRSPPDTKMYVDFSSGSSVEKISGAAAATFRNTTPASSISNSNGIGYFDMNGTSGSNRFASLEYSLSSLPWINISVAQPVCVACWAKPEVYLSGTRSFLSRANNNNNTLVFGLHQNVNAIFADRRGTTGGCFYMSPYGAYTNGIWSHFAFTFKNTRSSGDRIRIYLNGMRLATTNSGDVVPTDKISVGTLNIGADYLYIDSFFGELTKMQLYFSDLEDQDVLDLYNGGI